MPPQITRLQLLRAVPDQARVRTLIALMELGSTADRVLFAPELANMAIQSLAVIPGEPVDLRAAAACICVWTYLPEQLRRVLLASDLDWLAASKAAACEVDASRRVRVSLAAETHPAVIGVLSTLIKDPHKPVVEATGQVMSRLAERAVRTRDSSLAKALAPALHGSIESFDVHRSRAVVEAVWMLLSSPARAHALGRHAQALVASLQSGAAPSRSAARTVLRTGVQPWVRARAMAWLIEPSLRATAIERLARAEHVDEHEQVLEQDHLLLRATRLRALKLIRPEFKAHITTGMGAAHSSAVRKVDPGGPLPSREQIGALSARAARGLPRWSASLDMNNADRARALEPLLSCEDPWARHAAARVLDGAELTDYLLDHDPRVARLAAWRWSMAGLASSSSGARAGDEARARLAARMARSPVVIVRTTAVDQCARFDPTLWHQPLARVTARRWLSRDRGALVGLFAEALCSDNQQRRLGAAIGADQLGLGVDLFEPLAESIRMQRSHDPVAAASVRALARCAHDTRVLAVIDDAMVHPDSRVRSNALEGIDRWMPGRLERAGDELLHDAAHRLRAAAVRAMLTEPKRVAIARSALLAMLRDERVMHRVSGSWVAARCGVVDVAGLLNELATGDPDRSVRTRAAWSLRRLSLGTAGRLTGVASKVGTVAVGQAAGTGKLGSSR